MKLSIGNRWPIIVVALLGAHVTLMMWALTKCRIGDAGVIPNYYEKAVHYDEYKADQAHLAAALAAPATQPNAR